jgi:hypothetical protein
MACAKPILVGNQDGSREAVIRDNGYAMNPFDLEAHKTAIRNYADNADLLSSHAQNALAVARNYFDYEHFKLKHEQIFRGVELKLKVELEAFKRAYPALLITGLFALLVYVFNEGSDYVKVSYIITFYLAAKPCSPWVRGCRLQTWYWLLQPFSIYFPRFGLRIPGKIQPYFLMRIPQETYYSYVLYAFIALWVGFSIPLGKRHKDIDFINALKMSQMNAEIGIHLIVIGFIANYASKLIEFAVS